MTLRTTLAPLAALALTIAAVAPASAQEPVPQDNSGGGQYLPSVPEGGGKKPEKDVENDAKSSDEALQPTVVEELEAQGADGAAAAAAAAATAPDSRALKRAQRRAERRKERRAERRREQASREQAENRLATQNASAGLPGAGDERLGVAFPIFLGASLLATLGVLAWRRRRGPDDALPPG